MGEDPFPSRSVPRAITSRSTVLNIVTASLVVVSLETCMPSSSPIQGSLDWRSSYHLAGDLHDLAPPRTSANVSALRDRGLSPLVDTLRWDACRLPLKTSSVDAVVTDLVRCCLILAMRLIIMPSQSPLY